MCYRRTSRKRTRSDSNSTDKRLSVITTSCLHMWFYLVCYACTFYRSASDTSVVTASPIAPRRSERLLALKKSKEASAVSLSESKAAIKEATGGKGVSHQFGESSKTTAKGKKIDNDGTNNTTGKTHDKQTTSKRSSTKKSQSESDLTPKRKRRRTVSPEEDKPSDKTQRTSSRTTGVTSANQLQSSSKKAKTSASEPLLTLPKGKTSGGQDKGKRTSSSRESKTSRKGKSSAGTSTSGVTTRQLRKLKGRNLTAEMSSDE